MLLSYAAKRQIIRFISNIDNWENKFDVSFVDDPSRKWRVKSKGDMTIELDSQNMVRRVQYRIKPKKLSESFGEERKGFLRSVLHIEQQGEKLTLKDESNNVVSFNEEGICSSDINSRSQSYFITEKIREMTRNSSNIVRVSEAMGLVISFTPEGDKIIYSERTGEVVSLTAPKKSYPSEIRRLSPFLVVVFANEALKDWGIDSALSGKMATNLVVGRELGIEPNLTAFNELDPKKAGAFLNDLRYDEDYTGHEAFRRSKSEIHVVPADLKKAAEKPWYDSTEFSGYTVDVPRRFSVSKIENGFSVATAPDYKNWMVSHGDIMRHALEHKVPPMNVLGRKEAISTFLHALSQGTEIIDRHGEQWRYAILETSKSSILSYVIRKKFYKQLDLDGGECLSLSFTNNKCLIAMKTQKLEQLRGAHAASVEFVKRMHDGTMNDDLMTELIERGADLKYVEEREGKQVRSLADIVAETGGDEALCTYQGITGCFRPIDLGPR